MAEVLPPPTAAPTHARTIGCELPPDEWGRLDGLPISQGECPNPETGVVVVVERDGQIIGTWAAITCVHLEGVWIDPAYQKNPVVAARLIAAMYHALQSRGISQALTVSQTPEVAALAQKLGGQPLGQLWLLPIPETL